MKNRWVSIVVVAALLAVAGGRELRAAVIFDNLPPTALSNGLQPTSGTLIAQQFSTDASAYSLSGVTLWMQTVLAGTPSVALYSDDGSGTEPGAVLASFSPLATVPGPLGPTTFGLPSAFSLAASTDYWVVLSQTLGGGGSYAWSFTNSSANSGVGASTNNALDTGSGWTPYASDPFQMRVLGDPPPPAVPEPSTFLLMGGLMMGAFAYRRKKVSQS